MRTKRPGVTAPIMFGRLRVLPGVTRFLAAYPDVPAGLVLTDRVAHFLDDQVDVALRARPSRFFMKLGFADSDRGPATPETDIR